MGEFLLVIVTVLTVGFGAYHLGRLSIADRCRCEAASRGR
jgi:hypothetical protein